MEEKMSNCSSSNGKTMDPSKGAFETGDSAISGEQNTILLAFKINMLPNKRLEFIQTAVDVIDNTRNEKGNISANIYKNIKDENVLFILYEWETAKDLNRYMRSDYFRALKWAMSDMTQSSVVRYRLYEEAINLSAIKL
jgi:quinol monooxygenase YgiN